MSDSLVDLLLVRLGKEEEKKKVLKLLISNLDLSVTDAENAVSNTPAVIKEAVPMNEARAIQKDLYPYIDLLPRLEDEQGTEGEEPAGDDDQLDQEELEYDSMAIPAAMKEVITRKESAEGSGDKDEPDEEVEIDRYGFIEKSEENTDNEPGEPSRTDSDQDVDINVNVSNDIDAPEEPVLVTSASEEIISTMRCHICGRTPTDGERLAPCRTCEELTCRNCFDRVAHVCNHCAEDGKTVERPNEGISSSVEKGLEFDSEDPTEQKKGSFSNGLRIAAVVVLVLAIFAAFYLVDPLDLFNREQVAAAVDTDVSNHVDVEPTETDTLEAVEADTTETDVNLLEDSSGIVETTVDTLEAVPDRLSPDEDPFGVQFMSLPEDLVPGDSIPSISFRRTAPRAVHADIPGEVSEILFQQLEVIASSIPVVVDDGVFLVYNDTTSVLIVVLLHPEAAEVRIKLMREVASWLIQTDIDQMVLVYRENRYQNAILYSLVHEAFEDADGIVSPSQFQGILGYREDNWESISGPVTQWLSGME